MSWVGENEWISHETLTTLRWEPQGAYGHLLCVNVLHSGNAADRRVGAWHSGGAETRGRRIKKKRIIYNGFCNETRSFLFTRSERHQSHIESSFYDIGNTLLDNGDWCPPSLLHCSSGSYSVGITLFLVSELMLKICPDRALRLSRWGILWQAQCG